MKIELRNMKTKKAMTLTFFIGLVVGVACLFIVFIFASEYYSSYKKDTDKRPANESLTEIVNSIKELKKEGDYKTPMLLYPKDWYIRVFAKLEIKPSNCEIAKSCICICKKMECGYDYGNKKFEEIREIVCASLDKDVSDVEIIVALSERGFKTPLLINEVPFELKISRNKVSYLDSKPTEEIWIKENTK